MITRLFVPFVLLLASAASAQNPVTYNPPSGSTVSSGSSILVHNGTTEWMSVKGLVDGEPYGDPILIPPGQNGTVPVPNNPELIGLDFELDPDTESDELPGH